MTEPVTWTCHCCGDTRPDDKISVHTTTKIVGGIPIRQNVRYCNDRGVCWERAQSLDFTPTLKEDRP
jgi:hypothetical protein